MLYKLFIRRAFYCNLQGNVNKRKSFFIEEKAIIRSVMLVSFSFFTTKKRSLEEEKKEKQNMYTIVLNFFFSFFFCRKGKVDVKMDDIKDSSLRCNLNFPFC